MSYISVPFGEIISIFPQKARVKIDSFTQKGYDRKIRADFFKKGRIL